MLLHISTWVQLYPTWTQSLSILLCYYFTLGFLLFTHDTYSCLSILLCYYANGFRRMEFRNRQLSILLCYYLWNGNRYARFFLPYFQFFYVITYGISDVLIAGDLLHFQFFYVITILSYRHLYRLNPRTFNSFMLLRRC